MQIQVEKPARVLLAVVVMKLMSCLSLESLVYHLRDIPPAQLTPFLGMDLECPTVQDKVAST